MQDPYITALNSQKAAMGWIGAISENLGNIYTPGYREKKMDFSEFLNGVMVNDLQRNDGQGKSHPGKGPTNLYIEGKGYFVMRKASGELRYTRLGDFKFNAEGTMVNESGDKVQGYMLNEAGEAIHTTGTNGSPNPYNPPHGLGGPGHQPSTEINLWVDPANGKFFGKYDEYKVRSDGTVIGLANDGKESVPLYKIALVNFVNPGALTMKEDQMFVANGLSGEPLQGTGEIRSGLIEKSNTDMRANVAYLQQAKLQMDVTAKLISTNKTLLEEALRLIQ